MLDFDEFKEALARGNSEGFEARKADLIAINSFADIVLVGWWRNKIL